MQKIIPVALLLSIPLSAQWLNVKTPGIPRTPDGKPDLTAPAPRTADGKSGFWGTNPFPGPGAMPYFIDLLQELKDEAIFKPEAEALFQKRGDVSPDFPVTIASGGTRVSRRAFRVKKPAQLRRSPELWNGIEFLECRCKCVG